MKRRYLYVFLACFLCIEIVVMKEFVKHQDLPELDVVEIHELNQLFDDKQLSYEEIQTQSSYVFSVLNEDGELLYQSDESCATTLYKAWQNHNVVLTLKDQRQVMIQDERITKLEEQQQTQQNLFICFLLIQIITGILYLEWLQYRFFSPFQKLRKFAQTITIGNLDAPLLMDKHQSFGAFSESFDMMRVELKKAKEQEVAANQSKKELIAKLSHDIKTPVASIKAVSELMQVQVTSSKEAEQLSIILAKADQIDELISNLFHATLEELQQLDVHLQEETTQTLHILLKQADYLHHMNLQQMEDALLKYDPLRISQVFNNLFENAYKYADGSIDVTGICKEGSFELVLQDHGGGVAPEQCLHIQEKFYRGTNAEGKSGSGLGLYISAYFLQAMQASFTISNHQDGLRITIGFPYA